MSTSDNKFPDIKGFIRITNSEKEGCVYFRNNGFGTIDQIMVARDNIRIIGAENQDPVWVVGLAANIAGKWATIRVDETIDQLAEQINRN